MAKLPRCFSCSRFNSDKMNCEAHIQRIPSEVINQTIHCDSYIHEEDVDDNDEDYPIASGR